MMVLGLDTSNYTTSAAAFDGVSGKNCSRLLDVREGELGLRQSDALFLHTKRLPELSEALFRVERGVGRRPGSAAEGFRRGGLMATYLIGPLLVLNPPFTKWLLRELGAKSDDLAFEDTAVAAYNARLAEFRDEKINYIF